MTDFDDDDTDETIEDLFAFTLEERNLIERLGAFVRRRMVSVDPETLRKIAAFLYALERLPYATPDISLDIAIMSRTDQDLSYVSVEIDGQAVRLSTGGYQHSPDAGGDSFAETSFEIETGGFREGSSEAFSDWLDAFVSASGTIEVEGDGDTDLTEPAPEDGWDRLAKYWESHEGEADDW